MIVPAQPNEPIEPISIPVETGSRAPTAAAEPRSRRAWGRPLLTVVLVLLGAGLGWEAVTWPDVAALARENPRTTAFIEEYRGSGWFAPRLPVEQRWVPYDRISKDLKVAVLVGEDDDFFSHHGFAREEMKSALEEAWKEKRLPRGASTITQQLAKNLWLSSSRSPLRKLKEAALTRQLEARLKKRRIFEIYLNVAELGPGIYGAEAAARHYFGKSAANLTSAEAAQLAASLPYPEHWHPGSRSRNYRWRARMIERRMAATRWLWGVV